MQDREVAEGIKVDKIETTYIFIFETFGLLSFHASGVVWVDALLDFVNQ